MHQRSNKGVLHLAGTLCKGNKTVLHPCGRSNVATEASCIVQDGSVVGTESPCTLLYIHNQSVTFLSFVSAYCADAAQYKKKKGAERP
jgi:hypothetical protein